MHAGRVKELDHRAHRVRVRRGVACVSAIRAGVSLVPVVVHPRCARAARAVHEELHSACNDVVVTGGFVRTRRRRSGGDEALGTCNASPTGKQREDAHR